MLPAITATAALLRTAAAVYYLLCGTKGDALLLAFFFLTSRPQHHALTAAWNPATLAVGLAGLVAALLLPRMFRPVQRATSPPHPDIGQPLLFPCKTTHTRLFPSKHSFSYSYLLVGIPVRWKGRANGLISADSPTRAWYHVDPADYLRRGDSQLGLRGKLDAFLESEGQRPSRYPYAYLVTAARFLGYHFNPVSFWYLYTEDHVLAAMILEVNNTFDERRMYFLGPGDETESVVEFGRQATPQSPTPTTRQEGGVLKSSWPKDFHVSPFNSRKGNYSLTAQDPLSRASRDPPSIGNTINLASSKGHPKLVARVFSHGDAVDPAGMSPVQKALFLARWWWVGFATFPRIVKEAGALFFSRGLHVWYRPEPLEQSIGRRADRTEAELEPLFRRYLQHLVGQAVTPLAVDYSPGGLPDAPSETFRSPRAQRAGKEEEVETTSFRVLTPAFYARFAHYAHDLEAVFCELHESGTIAVSRPELLPKLVLKQPAAAALHAESYADYVCFAAIRRLRQRPERIERPLTSSQAATAAPTAATRREDIRRFRLSSMDGYVLSEESGVAKARYRWALLRLFLADRVALGSEGLLWLELFVLRAALAWLVV